MPDPVIEEFGDGLETPVTSPVLNTPSPSNDEWGTVRSKFAGLPEDVTLDSFADHVLGLQSKADKAAELEAKIAEYEALAAQRAVEQVQQAKPAVPAQATEEAYELPWKPVKVDPAFRNLVKQDPDSGMYIPTVQGSVAHTQAADEMNRRRQYEARIVQDMLDDPEKFGEHLTKRQMAAMRKEFAAQLEELKTQFTPIQQQAAQSKQQQEMLEFTAKHGSKLFVDGETMTPLGQEVDWLMREAGMTAEVALAKAEARLGVAPAPQAPAKPISISKAVPQQPKRFIDGLGQHSTNRLTEKPDAEVGTGRKWKTSKDLQEEFAPWGKSQN